RSSADRPRTRPHVASGSPLHHRCAAILPLRRRLRSGEEHQPIMPAACRFAVMIKDPIELVMRWL
ncbi:hypothetical protein BGY98DRAFT_1039496, partial [Russula aff. rugulosa BPL654]